MIKNEWKEIEKIKTARAGSGACVTSKVLYVFFGWDHTNANVRSIEYLRTDKCSGWEFAKLKNEQECPKFYHNAANILTQGRILVFG